MRSTDEITHATPGQRHARAADLYDAWLFAEVEATLAMAAWWSAPYGAKAHAHDVYVAALDREARAADALALVA